MNHNPIIIALDVENAAEARALVTRLGDSVDVFKIGMELYAAEGMAFARELIDAGKQVFLDLKLYDIGETVKRATARVAASNVHMLTVHGSKAIMRAAAEGRGSSKLRLLGVTVLTSFDAQDLRDLGYSCELTDLVALRIRNATEAHLDGIVCSALEARSARSIAGPQALVVTPGVRSASAAVGDQKRVTTPAEAIASGASYLVIGREVTRATDPPGEVRRILNDIKNRDIAK